MQFMMNLHNKNCPDIVQHVEKYVKARGGNEVDISDVFSSKPPLGKLYINPISFAFEPHFGPLSALSFSPFVRNLFLSASTDGSIKIFDLNEVILYIYI
jgi:WD40 repeat protein